LNVRFLIDAQLPPGLTDLFKAAGHDAVHVMDVDLLTAGDTKIGAYAVKADMVVVTKDEDFATMRRLSSRAPRVVWVRFGNTTNRVLKARMGPALAEILDALGSGEDVIEVR
jgi:predicted nuclease of predicted toxin-antitoxin system